MRSLSYDPTLSNFISTIYRNERSKTTLLFPWNLVEASLKKARVALSIACNGTMYDKFQPFHPPMYVDIPRFS